MLGWLLAGIANDEHLSSTFVFKGGTCLKKLHFETYRFSEDLDFTVTSPALIDEQILLERFRSVAEWIYEHSGIEIPGDQVRFELYENKRGRTNVEGRVYYRGPITTQRSLPKIKLDLTADEVEPAR